MRKTTVELTDEQYFYLKEKVLELQKRNHTISMVSLIRQLIDQDIKRLREGDLPPKKESSYNVSLEGQKGKQMVRRSRLSRTAD